MPRCGALLAMTAARPKLPCRSSRTALRGRFRTTADGPVPTVKHSLPSTTHHRSAMVTARPLAFALVAAGSLFMAGVQAIAGEPTVPEASTVGLGQPVVTVEAGSR